MAKPVFPVIEEGVVYTPGDLKQSLGNLWYEGVEDDINRRMINSLDDLRRVKGGRLASQAIKGASNIARGIKTDQQGKEIVQSPPSQTALQKLIQVPESEQKKGINWFGRPAEMKKVSDLTEEQIETLDKARGMGIRGLVHILNNLANPLQPLQESPLQQQATSMMGNISGPLLLSLLNQPSPSSFAPMYPSQLAQQSGPGLSDILGTLAGPALQAALPYISSLFNKQG